MNSRVPRIQLSKLADSLDGILRKPLFGTKIIPRDASVDPPLFPDDEYPICCERCGYLLRGLPDGRCPECGTEFNRAQRLVSQYVFGIGKVPWKQSAAMKWCKWLWIAGSAIILVPILSLVVLALIVLFGFGFTTPEVGSTFMSGIEAIRIMMLVAFPAGPTLFLAGIIFVLSIIKRQSAKRRDVVRAIHASD